MNSLTFIDTVVLSRVAERPAELDAHLETLRKHELVHETQFFPSVEYAFKHALVQDVAYETLLGRRRRELHLSVGRVLEEIDADRLPEVLAHHFGIAEERAKAIEYLCRAADKSAAAFANREASAYYERALALLGEDDLARRASILHRVVDSRFYLDDFDTSLRWAREALDLYSRLGDRRQVMAIHVTIAGYYIGGIMDGAWEDRALEHLEVAAALSEGDPDSIPKGLIYQRTAHLYLHRGEPTAALGWARRAQDVFARLGSSMGTCYGTAQSLIGHVDQGVAYNEGNWAPVLASGNPMVIAILGHEIGVTLVFARDVTRAHVWGERVLSECLQAREANVHLESIVRRPLAIALTLAGDQAAAAAHCERVEDINRVTWAGCPWEDVAASGFVHLRSGDWQHARSTLDRCLAVMSERNQIAAVSGCAFVLGCLDLAEGKHADAETNLRRSLEICRHGGNVLFELWILPVLTELYLVNGNATEAAACVQRGFELLAPGRNWYGLPAGMYLARGMLARERCNWDEAHASFERALAVNREHRLPWDEAKTEFEWAAMLHARDRVGDRETARQHLAQARQIFERIGARRDVARVLAAAE